MNTSVDAFHALVIIVAFLCTGGLAGFMSGLLGIGGGLITVPVLTSFFLFIAVPKADAAHVAVATSLATIIPTSFLSFRAHLQKGAVDLALLKRWLPFLALGAVCGSLLAGRVPAYYLQIAFGINALYFAYRFWTDRTQDMPARVDLPYHAQHALVFLIGLISAMLGIGGGVFAVMLMTALGMPILSAVASASAFGVTSAIPGAIVYALSPAPLTAVPFGTVGLIHPLALALLLPTAMLMPSIGAKFAHRWPPRCLKQLFAVLMLVLATKMIVSALI